MISLGTGGLRLDRHSCSATLESCIVQGALADTKG